MVRPSYNFTCLPDFIQFLDEPVDYLEKATKSDLGDWTPAGKIRNAGYNNYTLYWDWYDELGYSNYQGEPYCAGALSVMFVCAFGLTKAKKLLCGDLFIYCPTGYNQFKNKGRIYKTPKAGDTVFFWSSSLGRWGHVGVVISVDSDGNGYTTWEANTTSGNDIVVRNGGATCKKHYTLGARKAEFGRPDYEGNGVSIADIPEITYSIGTGSVNPLVVTATSLNVRASASTNSSVVGNMKYGDPVVPTLKAFENGDPWFYVPSKGGWISAKYLEGWVQEHDHGDKWWYVLPGYNWYTNQVAYIDGNHYFFDSSGYMLVGSITFTTDENGVLKPDTNTIDAG